MPREEDVDSKKPLVDPASPLSGVRPEADRTGAPASPFTTAAHRIASETPTDERALRQMEAERQEAEREEAERRRGEN